MISKGLTHDERTSLSEILEYHPQDGKGLSPTAAGMAITKSGGRNVTPAMVREYYNELCESGKARVDYPDRGNRPIYRWVGR